MENKEILKKIDALYADPKSNKFLVHLLHSYIPVSKTETVESNHEYFKCSITGYKLVSVDEALTIFQNQLSDIENFKKSLLVQLDENGNSIQTESMFKERLNGRILGYTGKDTSTYLCKEAIECLLNWTMDKILKGDKKINNIVNKLNNKNNTKKSNTLKKENIIPSKSNMKKSTTTLGDFDVLKNLKDKFETENK